MDHTKWLLLIGTSLVGLVLIVVWLVGGGADGTPDDQLEEIAATTAADMSNDMAPSPDDEDSGSTGGSGTATEEGPAETAGITDEGLAELATTTEELSIEACHQFEEGRTVADFADWFEKQFQGDEVERADVFRAVLTRALTDECPEVVPDS